MAMLESVPNVSEGRDSRVISELGAAFVSAGGRLLDVHVDADHHRSVFTLVGHEAELVDGLVAGTARARELIDLGRHTGVHPRVGAVDVVPVVPLVAGDRSRAEVTALAVARRLGDELELPVFLYGTIGEGRRPAFFRRGGLEVLRRRVDEGELAPSFGPRRIDSRSGALLVGARAPLLAFNIELHGTVDDARAVAAAVRESSGGLPGVQALGLALPGGAVQVSTNVVDLAATAPHVLVARIEAEAADRGARAGQGELVGLIPAASVAEAAGAVGAVAGGALDDGGVPTTAALSMAAKALRLERLEADRVLEWHLVRRAHG
jgi:glutamate formiminotransferase